MSKKEIKSEKSVREKRKRSVRSILSLSGKRIKRVNTLRMRFTFGVCVMFAVSGLITAVIFLILSQFSFSDYLINNRILLISAICLSCIAIGTGISFAMIKIWIGRITRISQAMRSIAKGNFKKRVPVKDETEVITEIGDLERSFNQMAADLESIEMFRNDFINNFSHEFKTPIVSIRGFARQLQSGNLSEEQKKEYIDIIVTESERLATMSQNILLLTKLENQQIVAEKTEFYLDEQIRNCILLLEKSWSEKDIELDLDLDEIKYTFNEEMLSHVWINLISNAIKFTPKGGKITFRLKSGENGKIFEIEDTGDGMSDAVKARIFEKFYQGDSSHATKGNGIGLNIVQRILTLAGGFFLLHFPGSRLRLTLSVILPCEARTFLTRRPFGMIARDRSAELFIILYH